MQKPIKIINIDGPEGVGKTTLISALLMHFAQHGIESKRFDSIETALQAEFTGTALIETSFATKVCNSILSGLSKEAIYNKHLQEIEYEEKSNHSYNVVNILMIPSRYEFLQKRMDTKTRLLNLPNNFLDLEKIGQLSNMLHLFDGYFITNNLKFKKLIVNESDSILELKDKALVLINE